MSGTGYDPPSFSEPPEEAEAFGRLLFQVAQDHLDPGHEGLEWSEGFTGGYGPDDHQSPREYGRKFGWAQHNDPGQAMVYVAVGDIPEVDRLPCGMYDNPEPARLRRHDDVQRLDSDRAVERPPTGTSLVATGRLLRLRHRRLDLPQQLTRAEHGRPAHAEGAGRARYSSQACAALSGLNLHSCARAHAIRSQ